MVPLYPKSDRSGARHEGEKGGRALGPKGLERFHWDHCFPWAQAPLRASGKERVWGREPRGPEGPSFSVASMGPGMGGEDRGGALGPKKWKPNVFMGIDPPTPGPVTEGIPPHGWRVWGRGARGARVPFPFCPKKTYSNSITQYLQKRMKTRRLRSQTIRMTRQLIQGISLYFS